MTGITLPMRSRHHDSGGRNKGGVSGVGLLDEDYLIFPEDVDLACRAHTAGWVGYAVGASRITHLGQQSTRQAYAPVKAELFRSKILYFRKHHGAAAAWLLHASVAGNLLVRRCLYWLQGNRPLYLVWSQAWQQFAGAQESDGRSAHD